MNTKVQKSRRIDGANAEFLIARYTALSEELPFTLVAWWITATTATIAIIAATATLLLVPLVLLLLLPPIRHQTAWGDYYSII